MFALGAGGVRSSRTIPMSNLNFDYFYKSIFFKKFISKLTIGGRFFLMEKIIYGLFKELSYRFVFFKKYEMKKKKLPIYIYFEVLFLCKPRLYIKV